MQIVIEVEGGLVTDVLTSEQIEGLEVYIQDRDLPKENDCTGISQIEPDYDPSAVEDVIEILEVITLNGLDQCINTFGVQFCGNFEEFDQVYFHLLFLCGINRVGKIRNTV